MVDRWEGQRLTTRGGGGVEVDRQEGGKGLCDSVLAYLR